MSFILWNNSNVILNDSKVDRRLLLPGEIKSFNSCINSPNLSLTHFLNFFPLKIKNVGATAMNGLLLFLLQVWHTEFRWLVHGQFSTKWWNQVDCLAFYSPALPMPTRVLFHHVVNGTPGGITVGTPRVQVHVPHSDMVCSFFEVFLEFTKKTHVFWCPK